jgi:hypothetical protein
MKLTSGTFIGRAAEMALIGLVAFAAASCGEVARTGQSPAFLIIDSLTGASGADPGAFDTVLESDVQVLVTQTVNGQQVQVPTVFTDPGRVTLRLGLRNPGTPSNPTSPSELNAITISRYRVAYRRSDGRNTPGVDVPYGFDGAVTVTISGNSAVQVGFDLVRVQAKLEPPLKNLAAGGAQNVISTIAEVTFFGRDQAGNEVLVTGSIGVNFSDWGDPS